MPNYGIPGVDMAPARAPVLTLNAGGKSRILLVCDHASNRIPLRFDNLGLTKIQQNSHISWDPGALAIASALSKKLDAVLIQSTFSRLLSDPNRYPEHPATFPSETEQGPVPGNADLSQADKDERIAHFHTRYHARITEELDARAQRGIKSIVVAVHSFSPTFEGKQRPWHIGLIQAQDPGFSRAFYDAFKADAPELEFGWNLPYGPLDETYYTPDIHTDRRGLPGTLLEIRNDQLQSAQSIAEWTDRIARCLEIAAKQFS